jgi:uncharacterized protein
MPDVRHITVHGNGKVETEPDLCYVTLGVQTLDKNLTQGKGSVDRAISKLLDVFKELQIPDPDIRAAQLSVNPRYQSVPTSYVGAGHTYEDDEDNEGQMRFIGHEVTRSAEVTLRDVSKLGTLLDRSVSVGANYGLRISFGTSEEDEFKIQAMKRAVEDAKRRATALASEFGVRLGKIYSIKLSHDQGGWHQTSVRSSDSGFNFGPIRLGMLQITSSLEVVFELAD